MTSFSDGSTHKAAPFNGAQFMLAEDLFYLVFHHLSILYYSLGCFFLTSPKTIENRLQTIK